MLKEKAVASLGQQSLLLPAWVKAALAANDRLKLYLTLLQAAAQHAAKPDDTLIDWGRDITRAGVRDGDWLRDLVKSAYVDHQLLVIPQLDQLLAALAADLTTMARPLCEGASAQPQQWLSRRDHWLQYLQQLQDEEGLNPDALAALTRGDRHSGDSLHLLIMDMHKQLNTLSADIATEDLDGAHVWQIDADDRPLIRAFMHGLQRTAPLKFDHPGLDTAVTRDGARLLIQNDIGTNDAHVLVITVEDQTIALTYSDLHVSRFRFFCDMLAAIGFSWSLQTPTVTAELNAGKPYQVGSALLRCETQESLCQALEGVAARIVFVIDWNRARKQLQHFVGKPQAVALLRQAAQAEWGHMAWLLAGGDQLVYDTMQAVDSEAFRVGDRLDDVIGATAACEFLQELLHIASATLLQQHPAALVADEARVLLARVMRQRTFEFDLLAEHAALCHALAQGLTDALENETALIGIGNAEQAQRAKTWERQADHLLMDARQRAQRQSRWQPMLELLLKADDVADALEEAVFMHSLTLTAPLNGLPRAVNAVLCQLANTTLAAIQDQIKAIEIARHLTERADVSDSDAFLQTLWRMLRAERQCDELLRQARITIIQSLHTEPAALYIANDLAATIEDVSDALLTTGYALRQMVFARTGISA